MDRDVWLLIEELFHQALAQPVEERAKFVESRRCSAAVRDEVMSLLACHETQHDWLNEDTANSHTPLLKLAVQLLNADGLGENGGQTIVDATPGNDRRSERKAIDHEEELVFWQKCVGDRYELQSILGRGGLGTVFRAFDNNLFRLVAIKVINDRGLDEVSRNRLRRESRAAAQTSSDYLVTIHAIEERDGIPFLVMEYVAGKTLTQWVAEQQRLIPQQAAELIRQVALGLSDAHQAGLIHRDIKPSNILVESQRSEKDGYRAKLTDFGLARTLDTGDSLASACVGTPAYMSPELIIKPEQVDQSTDIYSLGATFYQCLTGVPPYSGTTISIMRSIQFDEPLPVRRLNETVPVDLESICNKAMSKDAANRYASARAMAEDLSRFLSGQPTLARPITRLQRLQKWMLRNKKEAAWIAVSGLMALALTFGSVATAAVLYSKNREIVEGREKTLAARVDQLLHCNPVSLPLALQLLDEVDEFPREQLQQIVGSPEHALQERMNAAVACALEGHSQTTFLVEHITECRPSPAQCQMLFRALSVDATQAVSAIHERFEELSDSGENNSNQVPTGVSEDPTGDRREDVVTFAQISSSTQDSTEDHKRFRLAYLAACLGEPTLLNELCSEPKNPMARTCLIHAFPDFYGDSILIRRLLDDSRLQNDVRSAMMCALATTDFGGWERQQLEALVNSVSHYRNSSQAGLSASSEVLLKHLRINFAIDADEMEFAVGGNAEQRSEQESAQPVVREFQPEVRMVRIPLGTVRMGRSTSELYEGYPTHQVTIRRQFEIMDREVSVRLFDLYLQDTSNLPMSAESNKQRVGQERLEVDRSISPSDQHPMQQVTWYDAVRFCNWLSLRHQLPVCYSIDEKREDGVSLQVNIDWGSNGFRLPTEAEWEYACRAGAETEYYFGNDPYYFEYYGRVSNARLVSALPCGSLLPNRWGLFDMHGNVWEWCQDWKVLVDDQPLEDPRGPEEPEQDAFAKVYRGSGVATLSGEPTAAARGFADPSVKYQNLGFRLARSIDAEP